MRLEICSADKLRAIVKLYPNIWGGKVLDVGCRNKELRWLCPYCDYCSIDIDSSCKPDIVADIETWSDDKNAFGIVVALDVLEHTNNICAAFKRICRVSLRHVLISLPNLYYWKHRLRFLFGKNHSGKYGLPIIGGCNADRHRWLFTLPNARDFVYAYASACNFRIVEEVCLAGPRYRYLRFLPRRWPTLFAQTYVVLLERR